MLSIYMPTLEAPSEDSPEWYKKFHNLFYLSQISGLTFLSYMDSMIESNKINIIESKEDELLQKKIIIKDGNDFVLNKKEDLKSIDVEDMIHQIIPDVFNNCAKKMNVYMLCMGVKSEDPIEKNVNIKPDKLLNQTNSKNWYGALKGFLNVWEFMFLYSTTETILKEVLEHTKIRSERLIPNILSKYPICQEFESDDEEAYYIALWNLFTEIRNIYSHTHGIITTKAKCNLSGKIDKFKKTIEQYIDLISLSLLDIDSIFTKQSVQIGKFYLLRDKELNIFRNFIVMLMEEISKNGNKS